MSGDGTDSAYAPKSPDLSSFDLPGPTPPAEPPDPRQLLTLSQQSEQSQSNFSHLQPPASPYFPSPHQQPTHAPHPGQQHHHQLATPPHSRAQARPTSYPSTTRTPSFDFGRGQHPDTSAAHHTYFPSPSRVPTQPLPGYTAPAPAPPPQQPSFYQPPPYGANYQYQYQQHQQFPPQTPNLTANLTAAQAQARQSYSYPSGFGEGPVGGSQAQHQPQLEHPPLPPHHHTMPPRRAAAAAAAAQMAAAAAAPEPDHELEPMADEIRAAPAPAPASAAAAAAAAAAGGGVVEAGPVKTKFPTARIKRIMQADEEVGKVAQQTPIAVGKALELFMVALVTKSAEVARQRSSKRVSAQMLKQVVESDDQWDFLRDIVSKVEVGEEKAGKGGAGGAGSGAGGTRVKAESESEDEAAAAGAAGGKRKRGGGRKKKVKGEM